MSFFFLEKKKEAKDIAVNSRGRQDGSFNLMLMPESLLKP